MLSVDVHFKQNIILKKKEERGHDTHSKKKATPQPIRRPQSYLWRKSNPPRGPPLRRKKKKKTDTTPTLEDAGAPDFSGSPSRRLVAMKMSLMRMTSDWSFKTRPAEVAVRRRLCARMVLRSPSWLTMSACVWVEFAPRLLALEFLAATGWSGIGPASPP